MSKIAVYWRRTGNTEEMSALVAEGARTAGAEVTIYTASEFSADLMDAYDAVAFGCPSIGEISHYFLSSNPFSGSHEQDPVISYRQLQQALPSPSVWVR